MARAWVKVQLGGGEDARHAASIVTYWKSKRQATQNIVKAISLYYALLAGDTTLLFEYFPLLQVVSRPPVAFSHRLNIDDVTVTFQAKTEEEDLEDFLNEFGF
jgi:hypothetical protein